MANWLIVDTYYAYATMAYNDSLASFQEITKDFFIRFFLFFTIRITLTKSYDTVLSTSR